MRGTSDVSPSRRPSPVVVFKPRQVILLEQQLRNPSVTTSMARSKVEKPVQLKSEDEYGMICSVALWLESKGYSKVLKRFLSAAQIQDDDWKAKAHNLNEVFLKYLEICNNVREESGVKKQEGQSAAAAKSNGNFTASQEIETKKKKKRAKDHAAVIDAEETPEDEDAIKLNENTQENKSCNTSDGLSHDDEKCKSSRGSDEIKASDTVDQSAKKQKDKKKRKDKLASESSGSDKKKTDVPEMTESKQKDSLVEAAENGVNESKKASKKKKDKVNTESLDSHKKQTDVAPEVAESKQKDSSVEAAENGVNESKKASKKRKRKDAEEKENQFGQNGGIEEAKPKNNGMEEDKDGQAVVENKEEIVQTGQNGSKNVSGKHTTDGSTKVAVYDNGVDKSESKSAKKQRKNSDEPKSGNPFQRVKIDEVKFVDERLQDNSYWAKDGAETGYGAKAQEVLGQVKGRGFRHEKTKKKRGSYRGGLIDLDSHSIKFNYSDEE